MTRTTLTVAILLTTMLSIPSIATQPMYIQATKAEYSFSPSIPDPKGRREIVVRMEQDATKHFSQIHVVAFGKTYDLSKDILLELDNYSCSGLTAMGGYDEQLKSQAIYLRLSVVVFEQASPAAVIVVAQNGEITLRKQSKLNSTQSSPLPGRVRQTHETMAGAKK